MKKFCFGAKTKAKENWNYVRQDCILLPRILYCHTNVANMHIVKTSHVVVLTVMQNVTLVS